MMETDIEKMYMDLNELLLDICKFLSSDNLKVLSPKDKKLADSLIKRSKTQLQEISKLQEPSSFDEYVDMDGKKGKIWDDMEQT
ncbi:hypothetical protein NQ318_012877 [Aromia moschata]|uniref:Uncharacterized protein n=1 Tax=Aromia moschata TaxID=1265417 RepID=A0AAV8YF62_9CUCU|nr:hypothetical protein NQ318_012877 [Aromia moschata]